MAYSQVYQSLSLSCEAVLFKFSWRNSSISSLTMSLKDSLDLLLGETIKLEHCVPKPPIFAVTVFLKSLVNNIVLYLPCRPPLPWSPVPVGERDEALGTGQPLVGH